jgi:hypothetical protein
MGDLVRDNMRGMLPPSEARMRMCVLQVGKRGRWKYRDLVRWRFLWRFFPWYARELRYRGDFCMGPACMYWRWEGPEKKERGYCLEALKSVSVLNVTRVPAADRDVSTADNQELFESLANELGAVRDELVRDQNLNELPFTVRENRAMTAELDGLIVKIKAGYVRLSDLTERAWPLVKKIADRCKDLGVIAGAAYAAHEIIGRILAALF